MKKHTVHVRLDHRREFSRTTERYATTTIRVDSALLRIDTLKGNNNYPCFQIYLANPTGEKKYLPLAMIFYNTDSCLWKKCSDIG